MKEIQLKIFNRSGNPLTAPQEAEAFIQFQKALRTMVDLRLVKDITVIDKESELERSRREIEHLVSLDIEQQSHLPAAVCQNLTKFLMAVSDDDRIRRRPDIYYFAERLFYFQKRAPKTPSKVIEKLLELFDKYILRDYTDPIQREIVRNYFILHVVN